MLERVPNSQIQTAVLGSSCFVLSQTKNQEPRTNNHELRTKNGSLSRTRDARHYGNGAVYRTAIGDVREVHLERFVVD
jgi:hypothetical protein